MSAAAAVERARNIFIMLAPDEVLIARAIGSRRWRSCREAGSVDGHYEHDDAHEAQDQDAVGAEIALAKHLNVWPEAFGDTGSANRHADVGGAQVRSSRHDGAHLLIYPEDDDAQAFVLVIGALPRYRIVGAILAGRAKCDEFWSLIPLRHPCWTVPQGRLTGLRIGGAS